MVKNSDKEMQLYRGYEIKFYSTDSWSFYNDTAGNVIIFGIDNSSSSHADNGKDSFLVLGEYPIFELMEALVHQKKSFVLSLVTQTQDFA